MIKLTHESLGKTFLNGDGTQVLIIHAVATMCISRYRFIGGINQGSETEYRSFYNEDGEVFGFGMGEKKNLVSLHTPVRPIEEVMADMEHHLTKAIDVIEAVAPNEICVISSSKALLAEAQALGVLK